MTEQSAMGRLIATEVAPASGGKSASTAEHAPTGV
ncbi:hypothetical protein SO3561_00751 [Streptomyces olivochromogenes]|uniref:Uncharacterized protein n=1 Tax=Streptomyces olivochromogenes TaxID=1963 RepID=A0A250V514_STROL|nr:hypothetical protein SO3561_00751 [Streptomyces olivochromogenes]